MKRFFISFGLLSLAATAAAATAANLRRVTDLAVDLRSKHGVQEGTRHSSVAEVTIELTNYDGMQYSGPITVGGQSLVAIYDTGSYDIMTASDLCAVCRMPSKYRVYRNKSSNTFKKGNSDTRTHWFAGGSMEARQDFETVVMGTTEPTVKVENQVIWQVTETTLPQWTNPEHCKFTTIVGLGFGKLVPDTPEGNPPVTQLLERAKTEHFATCFQKGKSLPGYVILNPAYDFQSAGFASMFRHLPVVGHKHWAVEHNGVSFFNGAFTDRRCATPGECVAIIDSGTSLIGVPQMHMSFIMEFASNVKSDCSNYGELPDLNFDLGSHRFPLPPSAYVIKMNGKCYPAFQSMNMASDRGLVWVLGLPFLRHYYTLWDRQGPGMYIAEQGPKCRPKLSSNSSVELAHTSGSLVPTIQATEPTIGDIREARLPSWTPHGSVSITI